MQDLFGSVRRSLVFRTPAEATAAADNNNQEMSNSTSPFSGGNLVDKINSCIRKSRVFSKPVSPSLKTSPPIRWRKGELIGCGAFGRVYMGMNLDSGELLAVKQVNFFLFCFCVLSFFSGSWFFLKLNVRFCLMGFLALMISVFLCAKFDFLVASLELFSMDIVDSMVAICI